MTSSRRKGALYTAVAGMELCCLYSALVAAPLIDPEGFPPLLWLLSFYPAALAYNSALQISLKSRVPLYGLCWFGWIIWLAALFKIQFSDQISLFDARWLMASLWGIFQVRNAPNAEQITLMSSIALWWLGRRLSLVRIESRTVLSEFQFGIAILLFILFIQSRLGLQTPQLVPVILSFFLFSLFGMAAAHGRDARGWVTSLHRNHWLAFLVFYVTLVVASGLFLGAVIRPDLLKIMVSILQTAWEWIAGLINKLINFLMNLFPGSDQGAPLALPPKPIPQRDPNVLVKLFRIPESVRKVSSFIMACTWLGLILLALWRVSTQIFEWLLHRLANGEGVEVEPMSAAFREDLARLFKAVINLLAKWLAFLGWPLSRTAGSRDTPTETRSVREIYRQVLVWTASMGCPRDPCQTPHEYLKRLLEWLPEARGELGSLTNIYVGARYGPSVPSQSELERLADDWKKLRTYRLPAIRPMTPSSKGID